MKFVFKTNAILFFYKLILLGFVFNHPTISVNALNRLHNKWFRDCRTIFNTSRKKYSKISSEFFVILSLNSEYLSG